MKEADNVSILVSHWSSLFSSIIEKDSSIKSIRVSERYCIWITTNLERLVQSRDEIKRTY